ncbi:MAG TPA: type I polyketide synthase, partial [Actinophytocola sp.]|nr:type I polyketide synthase [Actinophytocola sp.]
MVSARGRLMAALPAVGVMAAVRSGEDEVRELLAGHPEVVVAAVNGPESVVISGPREAAQLVVDELARRGTRTRWLAVDNAFHSPLVDPVVAPFADVVAGMSLRPPTIPVVSTVTGAVLTAEQACSADYWAGQVRATVRFADAITTAAGEGIAHYVELGPGTTATAMVRQNLDTHAIATLRDPAAEQAGVARALAELWVRGVRVDWTLLLPAAEPVDLPTYAFQRERYWLEVPAPDGGAHRPADAWRYRIDWTPVPFPEGRLSGDWLVFVPEGDQLGWVRACLDALDATGARVAAIPVGADIDRAAVAAAVAGRTDVSGVVSLLAALPGRRSFDATAAIVQGLGDADISAPLWTVTCGGVAAGSADADVDAWQAMLWGLGRVAAVEHPERWGGLLDLPADPTTVTDRLAGVLSATGEDQVAIRDGRTYARRLRRHPLVDPGEWRLAGGTVLITGGTGGLGAHTARWLAGRGADHIVLASRRGPDAPGADALVDELRGAGVRVNVIACDLADRDAVADLVDVADHDRSLRMVVHAAGVGESTPLAELTPDGGSAVLGPKVLGARHLDEVLGDRDLDAFVVFSSIAGVWGSGRQPAYAAANAYLDGLVAARRARGRAATSVAWGPWAGAGLFAQADVVQFARRGLLPMAPDAAIIALEQALAAGDASVVVADIDWDRFVPAFTSLRPSPLLTALAPAVE